MQKNISPNTISRQLNPSRLANLWTRLTGASPSVTDAGDRLQAQLAAAISLGLAILTLIGSISGLLVGSKSTNSLLLLAIAVITGGMYWVTRGKYFKVGSAAVVLVFAAAGYALALSQPGRESSSLYALLPIALVLGSLLLPLWGLAVLTGGSFLIVLLMPLMDPAFIYSDAFTVGGIFLTLGALLVIAVAYRNSVERIRVAEVTNINKELRILQTSLEQRVADRTKALATSSAVSRRLTAVTNPRQLTEQVVEQVKSAFNYYHAHIYFREEATGDLVMAGGTGEAGAAMLARGHRIQKGRGLVGRAAETGAPVLVPDVSQAIGWLPNPLLPETKAEVAIPISTGQEVLGVLDVQQNRVNGLGEDDVSLLQSIASQVAISLQNARSFEQSQAQAELESLVNTIGQQIQRTTTVEDALQTAIRGLGMALGASRVKASIERPAREN
jgi:putative methionine-R-sulfoxide reductase with GAF domain